MTTTQRRHRLIVIAATGGMLFGSLLTLQLPLACIAGGATGTWLRRRQWRRDFPDQPWQ